MSVKPSGFWDFSTGVPGGDKKTRLEEGLSESCICRDSTLSSRPLLLFTVHGCEADGSTWRNALTTNRVGMKPVTLSPLRLASTFPNYLVLGLLAGFLCRSFKMVSLGLLDTVFSTPQRDTPEHLSLLRSSGYLC